MISIEDVYKNYLVKLQKYRQKIYCYIILFLIIRLMQTNRFKFTKNFRI